MGVSTDAILAYGYVWEDEADASLIPGVDDSTEWEHVIAGKRGIVNPWDLPREMDDQRLSYEERMRLGKAWTEAHGDELDAWRNALKAITAEYGVDIDSHGSDEWQCPVVKIKDAGHRAPRGCPWELTAAVLAVDPGWDAMLTRFVTDLGIDTADALGPGWFLMSYWG